MSRYELIAEALQEKVNLGELTLEEANKINDLAYSKYVEEASKENKDLELIDKLRELVEAGTVKLSKEDTECIQKLIDGAEKGDEETAETDEPKEEEPSDEAQETPAE